VGGRNAVPRPQSDHLARKGGAGGRVARFADAQAQVGTRVPVETEPDEVVNEWEERVRLLRLVLRVGKDGERLAPEDLGG